MALNENARKPDLTIFLNASDRVCYERMRNRQEDKELFERHLSKTRKKYADAIEFLRNRGDKIVEVNADGTMAQVNGLVLDAIHQNSPSWFSEIQMQFPFDHPTDLFEQVDISVISVANKMSRFWNLGPLSSENQLTHLLKTMETEIDKIVWELEFSPCASLFFDSLKSSGYEVLDKLPWIDLDAFEIRFTMPLGLKQYGAALLLGSSQRYDVILKKLLSEKKVQTLDRMSDFLFIFDSNPSHLISHHYERDIIKYAKNSSLSPSVTVIGRKQIANMVFNAAVEMLQEEHMFTLRQFPKLWETLIEFRNAKSSSPEWNGSH